MAAKLKEACVVALLVMLAVAPVSESQVARKDLGLVLAGDVKTESPDAAGDNKGVSDIAVAPVSESREARKALGLPGFHRRLTDGAADTGVGATGDVKIGSPVAGDDDKGDSDINGP